FIPLVRSATLSHLFPERKDRADQSLLKVTLLPTVACSSPLYPIHLSLARSHSSINCLLRGPKPLRVSILPERISSMSRSRSIRGKKSPVCQKWNITVAQHLGGMPSSSNTRS